MPGYVVVRYNHLPYLRRSFADQVREVGEEHAAKIVQHASDRTTRVDTGAMKAGYRYDRSGSEWTFYNTQDYHIYQELGTATISPAPMLIPAFDEEKGPWMADLRKLPRLP